MRRVLFVDHVNRILGGAEINLVELLAEAAARKCWAAACACPAGSRLSEALLAAQIPQFDYHLDSGLNELRLVERGFAWRKIWRGISALRATRRRLAKLIAEFQPDAVVSCTNKDHFAASGACAHSPAASFWWVNDIISPDFFPWPARFAFKRAARRRARKLIVVSDCARDALLREGLPAELVARVHNGIPLDRYQPAGPGYLHNLLGLPGGEPLIALIGRFTPWKGQDFFLRLAKLWCAENSHGHFLLIGQAFNEEQAYETQLRAAAVQPGLAGRVHFIPFQAAMNRALGDLAVVVHASTRPEPFGRIIIEAMAAGVPVIAARAGGVPEVVSHGRTGWLASPGVETEYLAALREALHPGEKRDGVIRAARREVEKRFNVGRVLDDFERIMSEV